MPVRALRFLHAANLRLDASLSPLGAIPDDLQTLLDEAATLAFSQIVTSAIEHDVDALLITGNTFDAAAGSLSAEATLHRELQRLDERGLPVFITPGQLDPAVAWQEIPSLPDNVTVFLKGNEAGIELTDQGRRLATILPLSPVTGVEAPELERLRASGALDPHRGITIGLWIPDSIANRPASSMGFSSLTYLAAGTSPVASHLPLTEGHVQLQNGPQGLHTGEPGRQGCQFVEIDANGAVTSRLLPVAPVRWETCQVDGRGVMNRDELCERMLARLDQLAGYPGEQVRIITWPLDHTLLEFAGVVSERDLHELHQMILDLTDQPKQGLRYVHCLETVWDEEHFPAAVDRELWHDYLAEMERWTPLQLERLIRLWEQQTGNAAPPTGWTSERAWPPAIPERVRRLALQNGRRWFRAEGASR